jgi:sirohydrochlorin cobaltochelatase
LSIYSESEASAYFLIAHGSRDPRSRQALEACVLLVRQELAANDALANPWPLVGSGVLEFGDRSLAEQIATFARAAARDGVQKVYLLPLFLMMGNHVQQDLPNAIQQAQDQISPDVNLVLCPSLGSHPDLGQLVRERMAENHCDRWLLIAHGTRRTGGNAPIADLADRLGVVPSYWATEPSLETQLQEIASHQESTEESSQQVDPQRVCIMPYFLFTGSIIDAIGDTVSQLRAKFPKLELQMTHPLNPSPLLAKLLLDQCTSASAS